LAYFEIVHKTNPKEKYQVCYGTKIKLSTSPKTQIAPDISIQNFASTDDPDETMVELIMDAKFKYDESKAISIEQIHAFMQRVNVLKTSGAPSLPISLHKLSTLNRIVNN
jgi:hypothetical protein